MAELWGNCRSVAVAAVGEHEVEVAAWGDGVGWRYEGTDIRIKITFGLDGYGGSLSFCNL
jgi:hypothetical protein